MIYGSTVRGPHVQPTIFSVTTNGTFKNIAELNVSSFGEDNVVKSIIETPSGIYGSTAQAFGSYGTLFRIGTDNTVFILHKFGFSFGTIDGTSPNGIVLGQDGWIYGTTIIGGTNGPGGLNPAGMGIIFRTRPIPLRISSTLTGGFLNLSWASVSGLTYEVEINQAVVSSNWTRLATVTATNASTFYNDVATPKASMRLYRLSTP
jgi:hypothetical protein